MIPWIRKHSQPRSILSAAVVALSLYGVRRTALATWVTTHGGDPSFDGAFNYPIWSVVHFIPAMAFAVILPFQLWPGSRRRYPRVHRIAGRVGAAAGIVFSLTGLLLAYVMPARPVTDRAVMTTFGLLFPVLLAAGVAAARRGDIVAHRRWMLRVTAAALAPLTQRVLFPLFAATGIDSMNRFWDLFLTALWFANIVNFGIAEWWIRRTMRPMSHRAALEPRHEPVAISYAERALL